MLDRDVNPAIWYFCFCIFFRQQDAQVKVQIIDVLSVSFRWADVCPVILQFATGMVWSDKKTAQVCCRAEVPENAKVIEVAGPWIPQSGHASMLEVQRRDDTGNYWGSLQVFMRRTVTKKSKEKEENLAQNVYTCSLDRSGKIWKPLGIMDPKFETNKIVETEHPSTSIIIDEFLPANTNWARPDSTTAVGKSVSCTGQCDGQTLQKVQTLDCLWHEQVGFFKPTHASYQNFITRIFFMFYSHDRYSCPFPLPTICTQQPFFQTCLLCGTNVNW